MRDNIKALVAWIRQAIPTNGKVLEVGSYQVEGQVGYADLRPYFPGSLYVGVDMRLGPGVDCVQDCHELGFPDKTFSYVLCLDTLEHVEDPLKAMSELRRVLKGPGVLICSSVMDFPIHEHPADYWRFTPHAFHNMLKNLESFRIFFQGDPLKPHTVIGIGAKGVDLDLDWPSELDHEPLIPFQGERSVPDASGDHPGRRSGPHRYHYRVDMNDPQSTHARILNKIKPASTVLEVGCATGYMTRVLSEEMNCTVYAIEVDAASAELARPFAKRLFVGDVEYLDLKSVLGDQLFDFIIVADVLEHLKEPSRSLRRLRDYLRPDGELLISIPNAAHGSLALELLDGRWDYRKVGLLDSTHLRFFTLSNFLDMLEDAGFWAVEVQRVKVDPWNTELKTQWSSYPREVTAYLEKVNPEFNTYQFVIRALSMGPEGEKTLFKEKYNELKDAFSRLSEEMRLAQEKLTDLEGEKAALIERIDEVESQKRALEAELRGELARVEEELLRANHEITLKEQDIVGLKKQINTLEEERQRLSDLVVSLGEENQDVIRQRDKALRLYREAEDELLRARFQLTQVTQSLGWRMLSPYRRFVEFALPKDTRRRRLYQLITTGLSYGLTEGPGAFLRKTKDYVERKRGGAKVGLKAQMPAFEGKWHPLTFPVHEAPEVSIVIPVFNKSLYTFNCLKSLLGCSSEKAFEVIVVDDASSDDTESMMEAMEGVRYIKNPQNQGFIASCNAGAHEARGRYLVFLNNDTTVTDHWLDALISTFQDFHSVGLAGAKLVYPDGRLQEAGGVVFSDGTGLNYGKWGDPSAPGYNYVREVDYCSGAAIAIPKRLFEEIGGFDTRYAPAYYEDTDLCMEVRERGYRVMYQPFSQVIHHEGVTCGTDTGAGVKRYQEINRIKFLKKWGEVLKTSHLAPGTDPELCKERGLKGRLLVVDHYLPTPDKDSGSLRLFSMIEMILDMGWKVTFWPDNLAKEEPYCSNLQKKGVEVMYGPLSFEKEMERRGEVFDVALLLRPHIAPKYIEVIRRNSHAHIVYDTVDLHFVREERRARVEGSEKALIEAKHWRDTELYLANMADRVVVVTQEEKRCLEDNGVEGEKVVVIPNIHEVQEEVPGFSGRKGLMFIGGFVHPPNVDAMIWFVTEILPLVREEIPDITLTIVGSNPPRKVKELRSDTVRVTGYVPDVSGFFNASRVFVSPLRYGAGLKGKIGQALSYGLPVVTTSIGAEGFVSQDPNPPLLIADDEKSFSQNILRLYRDRALWERMSGQGRLFISRHFSKDAVRPVIERILSASRQEDNQSL